MVRQQDCWIGQNLHISLFFFAINNVNIEKGNAALWAINTLPLFLTLEGKFENNKRYDFLAGERLKFDKLIGENDFQKVFLTDWFEMWRNNMTDNYFTPFVIPLVPYHSHQRITIQQGLFLCQTRISDHSYKELGFEYNLSEAFKGLNMENFVKKYVIPNKLKPEIISELNYMNINDATLFPGLDGFSRFIGKEAKVRDEDKTIKYGKF